VRVCLLASGSKGNALFIETGHTRILVDAGLAARELSVRLNSLGVDGKELDALLVTHEHHDHCRGLGPMARRYQLPVYIHPETFRALPNLGPIGDVREVPDAEFALGDSFVQSFPLTHDAASPLGFLIHTPEGKIGVATDFGVATRLVRERLRGCRVLILESNHDDIMLRDGPYPWPLKQRIRGNHGHLSNEASADLLREVAWDGLEAVFLAHLSEVNNTPGLAEECAREVLSQRALPLPRIVVGRPDQSSVCLTF